MGYHPFYVTEKDKHCHQTQNSDHHRAVAARLSQEDFEPLLANSPFFSDLFFMVSIYKVLSYMHTTCSKGAGHLFLFPIYPTFSFSCLKGI